MEYMRYERCVCSLGPLICMGEIPRCQLIVRPCMHGTIFLLTGLIFFLQFTALTRAKGKTPKHATSLYLNVCARTAVEPRDNLKLNL
jgi:hypothetical protein